MIVSYFYIYIIFIFIYIPVLIISFTQLYHVLKTNCGYKVLYLKIFKVYKRNTIVTLGWHVESWEVTSPSWDNSSMELKRLCSQESFGNYNHKEGKPDFVNKIFGFRLRTDHLFSGRNSTNMHFRKERR